MSFLYGHVHFWTELTLARSLADGPALIWPVAVRRSQSCHCSLWWELTKCYRKQLIHITPRRKHLWATPSPDWRNKTRRGQFNHQVRFNVFQSISNCVSCYWGHVYDDLTHSRCCSLQCLCLSTSQMCLAPALPRSFTATERLTSFDTPDIKTLPSAPSTSSVSSHLFILHLNTLVA